MSGSNIAEVFRRWGYLQAKIDPLDRIESISHRDLEGLTSPEASRFKEIYCSSIGAEFMHMIHPERCDWIANRLEGPQPTFDQRDVLKRILFAESFERFLHLRYVGVIWFSLEGCVTLIPLLDCIINRAAELGFEMVMIAMSHRGRINVMHHIVGSPAADLIAFFEDVDPRSTLGSGDTKYHRGATGEFKTACGRSIMVRLASNPSHLEAVNPVIMGRVRARQERLGDVNDHKKILAINLHGDAAFAGQGITAETLNLSKLRGFGVGGTIHIIVNNLIGFTTEPVSLNSSHFCTDVAKRLSAPIFHVNADDPEAVIKTGLMTMDYRAEFSSEVVVDLVGYRRYGHNENDDPSFTSPLLYKKIEQHPPVFKTYAQKIGVSEENIKQLEQGYLENLKIAHEEGQKITKKPELSKLPSYWDPYWGGPYKDSYRVETKVSQERLEQIGSIIGSHPENFTPHPKLKKLLEQRKEMALGKRPVDWGMAEALAFGSLLWDKTPVRLTGQDVRRGTFSHRHAVLMDYNTGQEHIALRNLNKDQARFDIYDSMLSEAAVLGFEYGFSRDYPEALVCWEAQFGDFINGAQVIIDQFISSAEDKWGLLSGIVLLLPHGYEGRGPEHSSARMERFLQLAGEDNMQICQAESAEQYFHLLRRQSLSRWQKPLIVFTPKSALRLPAACSPIEEFINGSFKNVTADSDEYLEASRLIFCSGKIYHQLRDERVKRNDQNTAIVHLAQLYPLPEKEIIETLDRHKNASSVIWVQEEPANMGALTFIRPHLERLAGDRHVTSVKRSASASPATGSSKAHELEQQALLKLAFLKL